MYIKYMNMEKIAKKVENSRALRSRPRTAISWSTANSLWRTNPWAP